MPKFGSKYFFETSDIFLFTSRIECSPLVLFESASAGLPFFSLNVGNSKEISKWTGCGFVYENISLLSNGIEKLINNKKKLKKFSINGKESSKRTYNWKKISKKYLANIDSLLVLNEKLTVEKDSIIRVNKNINWKNYNLNKQNEKLTEKVNRGSVLEIIDVDVETLRYRGTGREVSTRSARKVQKIRVCFIVAANQISDAEEKIVYMQLLSSNGDIISNNLDLLIKVNNQDVNYTASTSFEYENIEKQSCFEWERVQPLEKDTYLINLIIEGRIVGQTELKLR